VSGSVEAGYLALHASGQLGRRAEAALARLQRCDLCPRQCAVDRLQDERDACGTGRLAQISSVGPHFGEEAPLVGRRGSGTVFFSGCNLGCSFCQNYDISHARHGQEVDAAALCAAFLSVQEHGCHNLNLVTPTHVTAQILEALDLAAGRGLTIPVVYNCGGYEAPETLRLLDGVVDIYLPDLKYADEAPGARYSGVSDYPEVARAALREMHRQVGDLTLDDEGVARRGLLVRHLVLPGGLAGTEQAMRFIAEELSTETYVNVMDQYRPCGDVRGDASLGRQITPAEYDAALQAALDAGLTRLDDRVRVGRLRWR
jgi:putative pyruvate formate lyase activating enzyme